MSHTRLAECEHGYLHEAPLTTCPEGCGLLLQTHGTIIVDCPDPKAHKKLPKVRWADDMSEVDALEWPDGRVTEVGQLGVDTVMGTRDSEVSEVLEKTGSEPEHVALDLGCMSLAPEAQDGIALAAALGRHIRDTGCGLEHCLRCASHVEVQMRRGTGYCCDFCERDKPKISAIDNKTLLDKPDWADW